MIASPLLWPRLSQIPANSPVTFGPKIDPIPPKRSPGASWLLIL